MVAVTAATSPLADCIANDSEGSDCAAFTQPDLSNDTVLPLNDGHNRAINEIFMTVGIQATMQRDIVVESPLSASPARRNPQPVPSGTPVPALGNSRRDSEVSPAPSSFPASTTLANR